MAISAALGVQGNKLLSFISDLQLFIFGLIFIFFIDIVIGNIFTTQWASAVLERNNRFKAKTMESLLIFQAFIHLLFTSSAIIFVLGYASGWVKLDVENEKNRIAVETIQNALEAYLYEFHKMPSNFDDLMSYSSVVKAANISLGGEPIEFSGTWMGNYKIHLSGDDHKFGTSDDKEVNNIIRADIIFGKKKLPPDLINNLMQEKRRRWMARGAIQDELESFIGKNLRIPIDKIELSKFSHRAQKALEVLLWEPIEFHGESISNYELHFAGFDHEMNTSDDYKFNHFIKAKDIWNSVIEAEELEEMSWKSKLYQSTP